MRALILVESSTDSDTSNEKQPRYDRLQLSTVPKPDVPEDHVLVKLHAAALNHRDVYIREGKYPAIQFDSILGSDGAGEIVECRSSIPNKEYIGKRVVLNPTVGWDEQLSFPERNMEFGILGMLPLPGTFAEYIAIHKDHVTPIPSHLTYNQAASLPVAAVTAYRAVFTLGKLKKGQKVLVPGIGGGVALFALQFAVAVGAEVYVTSSSDEKIRKAVELGAVGGVNYRHADWVQSLESESGGFFDLVIDGAAGPNIKSYIRLLGPGGTICIYGAVAGSTGTVNFPYLWFKHLTIHGVCMGSLQEFKDMVEFVGKHKIQPVIAGVFDGLERAEEAFEVMRMSLADRRLNVPGYTCLELVNFNPDRNLLIERAISDDSPSAASISSKHQPKRVICKGYLTANNDQNRRTQMEYEMIKTIQDSHTRMTSCGADGPRYSLVDDDEEEADGSGGPVKRRRSEYKTVPGTRVVKALEVVQNKGSHVLVLEDFEGITLRQYIEESQHQQSQSSESSGRKIKLEEALRISVMLTEALDMVHSAHVVHQDLNPDNILVRVVDGALDVQLIDFNLAEVVVMSEAENADIITKTHLHGTLAYISPEQTGRVHRPVDYRTDFYSLGVTMWEMFIGRPPFEFNDALDYVHAHIAREIDYASHIDPTIPAIVSDIIQKLVRKSPDARYQSAAGIRSDLNHCLSAVDLQKASSGVGFNECISDKQVLESLQGVQWAAGSKDFSRIPVIPPGKVYGRAAEMAKLTEALERICNVNAPTELIVIQGETGDGKYAMLKALKPQVVAKGCHLVSSKFQQATREYAYHGIYEALEQLLKQFLTSSNEALEDIGKHIRDNISEESLSKLLVALPDLKVLVPDVPDFTFPADPNEKITFGNELNTFIKCLASPSSPLVFFIQDVQCIDTASMSLIQSLTSDHRCSNILFLATFNTAETPAVCHISPTNLAQVLPVSQFHHITLKPLDVEGIEALLADALKPALGNVKRLAQLVQRKTYGNPLHIQEFLKNAQREKLLNFVEDCDKNLGWTWALSEIESAVEVSQNVADLMIKRISTLPQKSLELLQTASCIGDEFDVRILAMVTDMSVLVASSLVRVLVGEGYLLPVEFPASEQEEIGGIYLPDAYVLDSTAQKLPKGTTVTYRVRQATFSTIPDAKKPHVHLKIARTLIKLREAPQDPEDEDGWFCEIRKQACDHYNAAQVLLSDYTEVKNILELNYQCALRANNAGAPNIAMEYVNNGINMLEKLANGRCVWTAEYELSWKIFNLKVVIYGGLLKLPEADALAEIIRSKANNIRHSLEIGHHLVQSKLAQGALMPMLELTVSELRRVGIDIPDEHEERQQMLLAERQKVEDAINNRSASEILSTLAPCDENVEAYQNFLGLASVASHRVAEYTIFAIVCLKGVLSCLADGYGINATELFSGACIAFADPESTPNYERMQLLLALSDATFDKSSALSQSRCRVVQSLSTACYVKMVDEIVQNMRRDMEPQAQTRKSIFANLWNCVVLLRMAGENGLPPSFWRDLEKTFRHVVEHPDTKFVGVSWRYLYEVLESWASGAEVNFQEKYPDFYVRPGSKHFSLFLQMKGDWIYDRGNVRDIVKKLWESEQWSGSTRIMDIGLVDITCCVVDLEKLNVDDPNRKQLLARIDAVYERVSQLADNPSREHLTRKHLALAEKFRAHENIAEACTNYEKAISEASRKGFRMYEAIAAEQFGKFWISRGLKRMAKACLTDAYHLWYLWGSEGKCKQMIQKFGDYLDFSGQSNNNGQSRFTQSVTNPKLGGSVASPIPSGPGLAATTSTTAPPALPRRNSLVPARNAAQTSVLGSLPTNPSWHHSSIGGEKDPPSPSSTTGMDFDVSTVLKISQSIRNERSLDALLRQIMKYVVTNAGATKGVLILVEGSHLLIEAMAETDSETHLESVNVLQSIPVNKIGADGCNHVPLSVIYYVHRSRQSLVLNDPLDDATYGTDRYIKAKNPRSILCCPIVHYSSVTGIVYLENDLQPSTFTQDRVELIQSLMPSASISIENAKLTKTNTLLKTALTEKEKAAQEKALAASKAPGPKYNISAPIQRAIDVLRDIQSRLTAQGDPSARHIDFILNALTSSDLFVSSIDEINDQHGRGIDQDTKSWIENSLLQRAPTMRASSASRPHSYIHTKQNSDREVGGLEDGSSSNGSVIFSRVATPKGKAGVQWGSTEVIPSNSSEAVAVTNKDELVQFPIGGTRLKRSNTRRPTAFVPHGQVAPLLKSVSINMDEVEKMLETCMTPQFDVLRLAEITNGQPLYFLANHLLDHFGLLDFFGINPEIAQTYFARIEASYHKLPYHNSSHASDVMQTVTLLLLTDPKTCTFFTEVEILAACVASAVHDVDHPGLNNNFLVQSAHPLAILYNDLSVLEYHHASKAFEVAQDPAANIFACFDLEKRRELRKLIISMVVATDMAQHFTYINKLKSKVSAGSLKLEETGDRALVLDMAIKCADLNNPTKSLESCQNWAFRVMEEFFKQGDRERKLGMPVSKFMDRTDTNIPKCQIGFIDILVIPLFETFSQCVQTEFTQLCLSNITRNRAYWESILDKPDAIPEFKTSDKIDEEVEIRVMDKTSILRNVNLSNNMLNAGLPSKSLSFEPHDEGEKTTTGSGASRLASKTLKSISRSPASSSPASSPRSSRASNQPKSKMSAAVTPLKKKRGSVRKPTDGSSSSVNLATSIPPKSGSVTSSANDVMQPIFTPNEVAPPSTSSTLTREDHQVQTYQPSEVRRKSSTDSTSSTDPKDHAPSKQRRSSITAQIKESLQSALPTFFCAGSKSSGLRSRRGSNANAVPGPSSSSSSGIQGTAGGMSNSTMKMDKDSVNMLPALPKDVSSDRQRDM
ncbi:hypothetical protein HDV05_000880 [Chytridiales sp. JEL 0842]|nr:hypothetical protein HDV05_000880 [Chytridiales sp. JEL 0842]